MTLFALGLGLLGLVLIYLEFFLPGGVIGVIGGALLLSGFVIFVFQNPSVLSIVISFVSLVLLSIFVCKLALWQIRITRHRKTLFSDKDQEGYQASYFDKALIGKNAEAISDLKPSGHILVEGQEWQAVSESEYIEKGSKVLVIGGKGAYLIVKKV